MEMLVLSRREGERLVIGDDVTITVNRISGNRITLGIDAPREVRIVRGELELEQSGRGGDGQASSGEGPVSFDVGFPSS
jgi:carbon storage regulator CsrA